MVLVRDVLAWLDAYAPFRYALSWDHCGLQVGDPGAPITRLLVALDPSTATLREAEERACQCLVTHHPLLLQPLRALRADQFPGNLAIRAVLKGIHLIAAHTNLDVARGGTNEHLSQLLSLHPEKALECDDTKAGEERYAGLGLIGSLPRALRFRSLVEQTIKALGGIPVRAVGDADHQVHQVALCTGSGGSLMEQAISEGADVFITGDVKYHEAQRALEAGLALIDIGHFASERIILRPLAAFLHARADERGEALEVFEASVERDPFQHVSLAATS